MYGAVVPPWGYMCVYLLNEEFPSKKIYTFLVAEDMPYMMNTKNRNSVGGFEDKVDPKLLPQ